MQFSMLIMDSLQILFLFIQQFPCNFLKELCMEFVSSFIEILGVVQKLFNNRSKFQGGSFIQTIHIAANYKGESKV